MAQEQAGMRGNASPGLTDDVREQVSLQAEREFTVVTFTLQRPDAQLAIVGEAGFRETLDRFSGGRDEDGAVFPHHPAVLVPEPDNRYDHDAVGVHICDEIGGAEQIGYLAHDDAVAYAPVLDLIAPSIPMCLATITGGWDRGPEDRRYHSAVLNLGSPAEMAAEWYYDGHPPLTDHRWSGAAVTFVGESDFAVGGLRLDAAAQAFLAGRAGCRPVTHVGPGVRLVVVGRIEGRPARTDGARAAMRAARQNRIESIPEGSFWRDLGYELTG